MRLIDADKLCEGRVSNDPVVIDAKCAPTVDAETVRHGRWEWHETWFDKTPEAPLELLDDGWTCSACGVYLMLYLQYHFPDIPSYAECASDEIPTVERCPCCGAKMDGGE